VGAALTPVSANSGGQLRTGSSFKAPRCGAAKNQSHGSRQIRNQSRRLSSYAIVELLRSLSASSNRSSVTAEAFFEPVERGRRQEEWASSNCPKTLALEPA
jgi:hypothetical protein